MSARWPIHTLVFDLDDTLYLEQDYVFSGFAAVNQWMEEKYHVQGFGASIRALHIEGNRGQLFNQALRAHGIEATAARVTELIDVYRSHVPVLQLSSDAVAMLDWAKSLFNLALITDGYAGVQERKLRALGLERWGLYCIVTDALGRENWKPSPVPYQMVMKRFSCEAGGCLYLGDNPRKDFKGARALGWKTVRIRRRGGEHAKYIPNLDEAADAEISNMDELRALMAPSLHAH